MRLHQHLYRTIFFFSGIPNWMPSSNTWKKIVVTLGKLNISLEFIIAKQRSTQKKLEKRAVFIVSWILQRARQQSRAQSVGSFFIRPRCYQVCKTFWEISTTTTILIKVVERDRCTCSSPFTLFFVFYWRRIFSRVIIFHYSSVAFVTIERSHWPFCESGKKRADYFPAIGYTEVDSYITRNSGDLMGRAKYMPKADCRN